MTPTSRPRTDESVAEERSDGPRCSCGTLRDSGAGEPRGPTGKNTGLYFPRRAPDKKSYIPKLNLLRGKIHRSPAPDLVQ